MKNYRITLIAALGLLAPAQLLAVPAWSRSEATSCSSCHATPTWQLTNVGLDFLKNGHRSDAFKFNSKSQTWDNYFSLVWKGRFYSDQLDDAKTGNANTQKPSSNFEHHSFSIYTGGALYDRFSYFTELYLSENTGSTSGGNIVQGDASRKKLLLGPPQWVAAQSGWAGAGGWIEGIWTLGVVPVVLWLVLAAVLRLAGGKAPWPQLWQRLALPVAVVVAAGHMSKGLAKLVSWLPFLPGAVRDPGGVETARAIAGKTLTSPAPLLSLGAVAWIGLGLVALALVAGVREYRLARRGEPGAARGAWPLGVLAAGFAVLIWGWRFA